MDGGPEQPAYLYELGSPDPEMARRAAISRLYGPMTGAWLDAAGIRPGMRVADLGCGPGDVTLAAAGRGGPPGRGGGGADADPPRGRARPPPGAGGGRAHRVVPAGPRAPRATGRAGGRGRRP